MNARGGVTRHDPGGLASVCGPAGQATHASAFDTCEAALTGEETEGFHNDIAEPDPVTGIMFDFCLDGCDLQVEAPEGSTFA